MNLKGLTMIATNKMAGIAAAAVYHNGARLQNISVGDAIHWSVDDQHVVWIGLCDPSVQVLRTVQNQFGLHPLAVKDAEEAHQFPKLVQYGDSLFIVARTAQLQDGRVAFGETHIFVGKGYVITVRHGASISYLSVREQCEADPRRLSEGEDYILYKILDFIVGNYFPVLRTIHDEVEIIEDEVLSGSNNRERIERLHALRRDLLRLRNSITPMISVCDRLERTEVIAISNSMRPHFRDVTDHVRHIEESIKTMREVLEFTHEANVMNAQMEQTYITRRLAAWAAILAVPTAIAGIYGMNFEHMPELKWQYGYFGVLAIISITCAWLYSRFKSKGWI